MENRKRTRVTVIHTHIPDLEPVLEIAQFEAPPPEESQQAVLDVFRSILSANVRSPEPNSASTHQRRDEQALMDLGITNFIEVLGHIRALTSQVQKTETEY